MMGCNLYTLSGMNAALTSLASLSSMLGPGHPGFTGTTKKYLQTLGKSTESPRVRKKNTFRIPRELCRMKTQTGRINS